MNCIIYRRGDKLISLSSRDSEFDCVYNRNIDTVYRICFMYLKNKHGAEDMSQNTFIKYLRYNPSFKNLEHEKAWFIVTATNVCKNYFKTWWYKNTSFKDDYEISSNDGSGEVLNLILELPDKYKQVIYMYYYEGYSTVEISKILGINESTIRSHLHTGRNLLKEKLGSEYEK